MEQEEKIKGFEKSGKELELAKVAMEEEFLRQFEKERARAEEAEKVAQSMRLNKEQADSLLKDMSFSDQAAQITKNLIFTE